MMQKLEDLMHRIRDSILVSTQRGAPTGSKECVQHNCWKGCDGIYLLPSHGLQGIHISSALAPSEPAAHQMTFRRSVNRMTTAYNTRPVGAKSRRGRPDFDRDLWSKAGKGGTGCNLRIPNARSWSPPNEINNWGRAGSRAQGKTMMAQTVIRMEVALLQEHA